MLNSIIVLISLLFVERSYSNDTLSRVQSDVAKKEITNYLADKTKKPVFTMSESREWAIINGVNASFPIKKSNSVKLFGRFEYIRGGGSTIPQLESWAKHIQGREEMMEKQIKKLNPIITKVAKEEGVDADLLRAVIAFESSIRGEDFLLKDKIGSLFSLSRTVPPANVHKDIWSPLLKEGESLTTDDGNIRVAARILRHITFSVENPTVSKVASIYNFSGREHESWYGKIIEIIYQDKIWEDGDQSMYLWGDSSPLDCEAKLSLEIIDESGFLDHFRDIVEWLQ